MKKEELRELLLQGFHFRHACKIFDENKKISDEDFQFLCEVARLSPSSFGLEAWRILIIQSQDLRKKLKPLCWNQKQITTASHLIAFITKKEKILKDKAWLKDAFKKKGAGLATPVYIAKFLSFLKANHGGTENEWSHKQSYIPMTNMMSLASFLEIDSCPIEGFEPQKVSELLELDEMEEVSILCAFGYRKNEQKPKIRRPLSEIISWI